MLTKDDELLAALERNLLAATLEPRQRAVVDYALQLTIKPGEVNEEDVARLRAGGFSDRAVHDAAAITAYFNFVNRIASGLGVELEAD